MDKQLVKIGDKTVLVPVDPALDFDEMVAQAVNKIEAAIGLEITDFQQILKLRRNK